MEELQIQKSLDLPNNHLIFRFEPYIGYNMGLHTKYGGCNRTAPKAQSTALTSRLSDYTKFTKIAKSL
ncbi:uncharacterized protein K441DRAFT_662974 [Cenococcum geophilum 1.58]|uniref:uncharacterized protein n=1 Tax=Cenococcum geophilum 1.58 TaxID=794803 RepID=UPI00358DF9C5|nr:hypothetical protein K441DRAFT_662974 [Cenococcum geophilum 1.58]